MNLIVIDKGEYRIADDPGDALASYGIDQGIVVALYDPEARVGGLAHFVEPEARADPARARKNPAVFADSGMLALFEQAYGAGADKKRLMVNIVGGTQSLQSARAAAAAKRTYLAVRKSLWKIGVVIRAEAAGGLGMRNARLEIESGRFWVRDANDTERELSTEYAPQGANSCLTVS